jgi:predicted transcriptional regulator
MADELSEDIKNFVYRYISSVEQLEVLLFLKDHPDSFWSVEAITQRFQSSPSSIERRLKELQSLGFLTTREGAQREYHYEPQPDELKDSVARMADVYATRRISIIELIFTKPFGRIRDFADAFKLKEDKEDG